MQLRALYAERKKEGNYVERVQAFMLLGVTVDNSLKLETIISITMFKGVKLPQRTVKVGDLLAETEDLRHFT